MPKDLEVAVAAFNPSRRERTQRLLQSSHRTGDIYEWNTGFGNDFKKVERELRERFERIGGWIWRRALMRLGRI
jgi:salicylate hydroxylase